MRVDHEAFRERKTLDFLRENPSDLMREKDFGTSVGEDKAKAIRYSRREDQHQGVYERRQTGPLREKPIRLP